MTADPRGLCRLRDTNAIQRGIVRHLYVIIDVSRAMVEPDLKPTRIDLCFALTEQFVNEFFDQNPISQLGLIITRDGLAEKLTELGGGFVDPPSSFGLQYGCEEVHTELHSGLGNATEHLAALRNKDFKEIRGEPSLQNALELARGSFLYVTPERWLDL